LITHDDGASTFLKLARPFLLTISHPGLLDCVAVDTAVSAIYSFISGSNSTRALPFFQALLENLNNVHAEIDAPINSSNVEETFTAASISLREVLRREQRAIFNDELLDLVSSFEEFARNLASNAPILALRTNSIFAEVRGMMNRAHGLLHRQGPKVNGVSTNAAVSSYPREIELPGGRHDNDQMDITEIKYFLPKVR